MRSRVFLTWNYEVKQLQISNPQPFVERYNNKNIFNITISKR